MLRNRNRRNSRHRNRGLQDPEIVNNNDIFKNSALKGKLDFNIYIKGKYKESIGSKKNSNKKIVAYTSICPDHKNDGNQLVAISSWNKLGISIYSINTMDEIRKLKGKYPTYVKFVPSTKTTNHIFGKPCISINAMVDHFNSNNTGDILMLINSDITLNATLVYLDKIKNISDSCITIAHRINHAVDFVNKKKYVYGFDVFFIDKKYVNIFPPSIYSMGQTWWDYWIPYVAIKNKIPTFILSEDFAFHKEHDMQYSEKDWIKMTEYFKWENNISIGSHQLINDSTRNEILNNSISFKL